MNEFERLSGGCRADGDIAFWGVLRRLRYWKAGLIRKAGIVSLRVDS